MLYPALLFSNGRSIADSATRASDITAQRAASILQYNRKIRSSYAVDFASVLSVGSIFSTEVGHSSDSTPNNSYPGYITSAPEITSPSSFADQIPIHSNTTTSNYSDVTVAAVVDAVNNMQIPTTSSHNLSLDDLSPTVTSLFTQSSLMPSNYYQTSPISTSAQMLKTNCDRMPVMAIRDDAGSSNSAPNTFRNAGPAQLQNHVSTSRNLEQFGVHVDPASQEDIDKAVASTLIIERLGGSNEHSVQANK